MTDETIEPLSLFVDDEGGYTSVAVALALLLSVTLVLFAGRVQWSLSRAAEVQEVADACSTAGANVVARYVTCAQACDALILSMGLAGLVTCGGALVLSCIPGAGEAAADVLDLGISMLESRRDFAQSAVTGLSELERIVPALVVLNSVAVVEANEVGGLSYAGVAVPFPLEGQSDFSLLDTDIDTEGIEKSAGEMRDATERMEDAQRRADEALERGWLADCGNRPRCMRERASTLAGLSGSQNPDYPTPESWTFGAAIVRARTYYPVRRAIEAPENGSLEALVDSCARTAFYDYAIEQLAGAYYSELSDGGVDMHLPELPHNTAEARATSLYTDPIWPCTSEEGRVLHATLDCPGAQGGFAGYAALSDIDSGTVLFCSQCQMDIVDMGKVAAASTSIDNGFEHYWREIMLASRDYKQARDDLEEAERELSSVAGEGMGTFEDALSLLTAPRPRIVPPGAWGCVAIVARTEARSVPGSLGGTMLDPSSLPPGTAISAAMLAPDDSAEGNTVLEHLFDGIADRNPALFSVLGDAAALWAELIVSYDSAFEDMAGTSTAFLEDIDGVFGTSTSSWVSSRVGQLVREIGIEPSDIRMMKPVLVSSSDVLGFAGLDGLVDARRILISLGPSPSPEEIVRALGVTYLESIPGGTITLGEIPIPGTGMSIPLEVDISELAGSL